MDKTLRSNLGGTAAIARICSVTSQAVSQWKRVPAEHVLILEEATKVSRHRIRPDVFGTEKDPEEKAA